MISIRRLFQHPAIPREYRANFTHLYLDIAWFGVLSGSAINFLNVYAARLGATGVQIGIGTSLFYLTVLIGSTQLNRIVRRIGHHKLTGFGAIGLSLYPGLLALSQNVAAYYLVSAVGGLSWAMLGGAYANYLLEKIPASDRPAHLAWYSLILNAAVLLGSLAGPALAANIGLQTALILFAVLRLLSGLVILKWGEENHRSRTVLQSRR
ncbi:MAG: MFS transporter [Anaerolineales bacterium]|nr:MFS transporter [Anaerolineales bacterium]